MSFIISLLSIGTMSHVGFKKWQSRRVEFRRQGPLSWSCEGTLCIASAVSVLYKGDMLVLILISSPYPIYQNVKFSTVVV